MERTKHIIIAFALSLTVAAAQGSAKTNIYQAFITNNMGNWKNTIDVMELKKTNNNELLLELINFQYGYIAWCIGNKRMDEARFYLDKAFNNLNVLEKNKTYASIVNTYQAAFYGFEIGLAQYKAPYYGLKSIDAAKKALALDAENWLAYIQSGNIQYYMPAVFGGSKSEAMQLYEKALQIIEKDAGNTSENWNYLNLLLQLAEGYAKQEKFDKAIACYEKIINIEPGFLWVKNELYPNIIQQKNKKIK